MSSSSLRKGKFLFQHSSNKTNTMSMHTPTSKLVNFIHLQSNRQNSTHSKNFSNKTSISSLFSQSFNISNNLFQIKKSICSPFCEFSQDNSTCISPSIKKKIEDNALKTTNKSANKSNRTHSQSIHYQQNRDNINKCSKRNQFLNRSQELLDLIQNTAKPVNKKKRKIDTLLRQKQSQCYSANKQVYEVNSHENFFDSNCLNKSASLQRINHLTKILNKETHLSQQPCGGPQVYSYIEEKNTDIRSKDLFKASFQRRLKNKMHDLKKFQFFINYQERKENAEKRAEFIANNLTIIGKIKEQAKVIPAEEEEIEIDELV